MISRWKFVLLVPCGALLLGLSGCDWTLRTLGLKTDERTIESLEDPSGERIGTQALTTVGESRLLVNREAGIALTLPPSWSEAVGLHPTAELQANAPDQQLYMIVVTEADESVMDVSVEENAERYRALLIDNLGEFEGQSPTDVAFLDQNFARQYEIWGRLADGTPVVYLHTTVATPTHYYQIVGWTSPEQYEFYKSELQNITATFEETAS
jgi:hypothetical protein